MKWRDGDGRDDGQIAFDIRVKADVQEDGTFEVPVGYRNATVYQRLIDAGHEPVNPEELPSGVTYETEDSGDSESEGEDVEDEDDESPTDELDEMDRSDLYQLGEEDLDLDLDWTGDSADDMRRKIREARNGS